MALARFCRASTDLPGGCNPWHSPFQNPALLQRGTSKAPSHHPPPPPRAGKGSTAHLGQGSTCYSAPVLTQMVQSSANPPQKHPEHFAHKQPLRGPGSARGDGGKHGGDGGSAERGLCLALLPVSQTHCPQQGSHFSLEGSHCAVPLLSSSDTLSRWAVSPYSSGTAHARVLLPPEPTTPPSPPVSLWSPAFPCSDVGHRAMCSQSEGSPAGVTTGMARVATGSRCAEGWFREGTGTSTHLHRTVGHS